MENQKNDKRCSVFLRKRDKYALPINLTYNGLKTFPTSTGGILSIMSTMIILSWLVFNIMSILHFEHTVSQSLEVASIAGEAGPIWSITPNQTTLATKLLTSNSTMFPGDIRQYIDAIYMQESYDSAGKPVFTYYNATNCSKIIDVEDSRYPLLDTWLCPDIEGKDF